MDRHGRKASSGVGFIHSGNVTIADSKLHDNRHFSNDPGHPDGTHDDDIQIQSGSNITITGNTLNGA